MMILLAQIDKVDPGFLHSLAMVVIGLLGGASAVAGIVGVFVKRRRTIDPQPLEVREAAEFVTVKECAGKHTEYTRRLNQHDDQIREIWNTLRAENTKIREEMRTWFVDTERALGRIEGKLDEIAAKK